MWQIMSRASCRRRPKKKSKKPEFSEEELRALQQYLDELPETETPSEEETAELYRKAAEGDSLAKSMLVQLWLPKVIETAKRNAHPRISS